MKLLHRLSIQLVLAARFVATANATSYQIKLNTSGLSTTDKWYLDYQLVASDLPGENSVSLSNFSFAGGSFVGSETLSGSVIGTQSTQYTLTDSSNLRADNVSELLLAFTPGVQVSFDMTYTNKFSGTGTPDAFFWAVEYCDPSSQTCALPLSSNTAPATIADPLGPSLGASLISNLDGVQADAVPAPYSAESQFNFITPTVTPISSVPEPNSLTLLLLAILAFAAKTFSDFNFQRGVARISKDDPPKSSDKRSQT